MRVVADTGPLLAAIDRRDEAHRLAVELVTGFGPDLIVPEPVIVECDYLIRQRLGADPARRFLRALVSGEHSIGYLTPGLLAEAVNVDGRFADLDLGITDSCVMAFAERLRLPILTFDFEHFRATKPARGFWRLIIDEARYQAFTRKRSK